MHPYQQGGAICYIARSHLPCPNMVIFLDDLPETLVRSEEVGGEAARDDELELFEGVAGECLGENAL